MGSLILSRSFHVEKWNGEANEDSDHEHSSHAAHSSDAMEVDATDTGNNEVLGEHYGGAEDEESDTEDEDYDDPADVAMVPLADMLNARYRTENVCTYQRHTTTSITH